MLLILVPEELEDSQEALAPGLCKRFLSAYRVNIATFIGWCETFPLATFLASPETVAAFVIHEAQRRPVSTIKRRLRTLGKIHNLLRCHNPISDEEVTIATKRILRGKRIRPR